MRGIELQSQPRLKQPEPRREPNMRARASVPTESAQHNECTCARSDLPTSSVDQNARRA